MLHSGFTGRNEISTIPQLEPIFGDEMRVTAWGGRLQSSGVRSWLEQAPASSD